MRPDHRPPLAVRVGAAAEAALADHQYVSLLDIFTGLGWLAVSTVEAWKKGRIERIEPEIQVGKEKFVQAIDAYHRWAAANGLKPMEAIYRRASREGPVDLIFTGEGDPEFERLFRTHYISPDLSERQQAKLSGRLEKAPAPVVFEIAKDSQCSECGAELSRGSFLFMDRNQPLCMPCANMDGLEFLPSGNTALTRRSTKYSKRSAVVVKFSRSRGRYERQGTLVEPEAIERAEQECLEDADARERQRIRRALNSEREDAKLVGQMTEAIRELYPGCPPAEARAIAAHTAVRGSGRVGRSAGGRGLEEKALDLAVRAAVRHRHTNYDDLLADGVDRETARSRVGNRVSDILEEWRQPAAK